MKNLLFIKVNLYFGNNNTIIIKISIYLNKKCIFCRRQMFLSYIHKLIYILKNGSSELL